MEISILCLVFCVIFNALNLFLLNKRIEDLEDCLDLMCMLNFKKIIDEDE